jgi:type II secretory pathway predicted ATPase ExeA
VEHLHHFGLPQDPFSNEPDLRFYFESATHRDAQRRVERSLRQSKGLTLLTGEGGMGKTLLARRILDSLEEEVFEATLLVMLPGAADATGIMQRFVRQLGCDEPATDRAGLLGQIYEHLAIVREDGRHAVLMIDDAQVMTPEVFAELGGLLNLEYEDRRLVSMLFVGSPELDRLVQNDASIMPRVDVRVRLQPLAMEDATAYLAHRLTSVGGNPQLVSGAAMETLFKFGRGRPRLLNTLADNALFEAYLAGRPAIDSSDVERAAADLGVGPDPGTTFSEVSQAPAPVAAPSALAEVAPVLEMPVAAEVAMPSLELTDETDDFVPLADTTDELAPPAPLEASGGLESVLEELESATFSDSTVSDLEAEPMEFAAVLETDVTPDSEELVLEAEPMEAELADVLEAEPEFLLAEAELSPIEAGDELDDAFVELIEE